MKKNLKALFCLLLIITFSFSSDNQALGQEEADSLDIDQLFEKEKVNITIGLGLPEALNIGVRYQLKQAQIGISIGTLPVKSESVISISGDVYFHFGELTKLSNRRPRYFKTGLNYISTESETAFEKFFFFISRIGRDFVLSTYIGINIDVGIMFNLYYEGNLYIDQLLPSLGLTAFYRI